MIDINCWESKFNSCVYSDRLLSKLLLLNNLSTDQIDLIKIKKAIYYAKKYHGTQKRQSGEPYYSHPLEVAYMVADYRFTTDILVTSILHDTIEDTELTKEMISYIFGSIIASQVEDLTRIKIDRKISSAEMITSLYLEKKHDLLLVKIFDRLHNMRTIGSKSPEDIKRIAEETVVIFIILALYLGNNVVAEELQQLCVKEIFHNQNYLQDHLQEKTFAFIIDDFHLPALC